MPDPNEKTSSGGPAREKADLLDKASPRAPSLLEQLGQLETAYEAQGSSVAQVIGAAAKALLGLSPPQPPATPAA